jgi:uncharacterized membrane protein
MMRLRQTWQNLRYSLWFLPGLIVLFAVILAISLVSLSGHFEPEVFRRWPRLFGSGAEGARGLLATVASSMITVAGVVFSITIVTLALASSQFSSRVLRNFMRDRVNQTVLGIFVGIFAYCLIVLRTIRGAEEGPFIPSLAVLVGLVLAFVGIGVLIYFIHHVSTSIQAEHILASLGHETIDLVDRMFPDTLAGDDEEMPELPADAWHTIESKRTGYVQSLDSRGLVDLAREHGIIIRMERGVGRFVVESRALAFVRATRSPDAAGTDDIRAAIAIGSQRTGEQDAAFGIRQIVDVALKALSPGINDTTTAVICIDYLTAILVRAADRVIDPWRRDEAGVVRLTTDGPTFTSLVNESFDQIRRNGAGNVTILRRLLDSIELLETATHSRQRRRTLSDHVRAVDEVAARSVATTVEARALADQASRIAQWLTADASG